MSELYFDCKQAARFLGLMEAMTSDEQRSFRKIYLLAPHSGVMGRSSSKTPLSGLSGKHVRVAMIEALAHPKIAYWVRMNLALRVARKLAQVTVQPERVARFNILLESFHVASDAFMCKLPIDLVSAQRANQRVNTGASPVSESGRYAPATQLLDGELERIQQFKRKIIPGFIKAIREKQRGRNGDFAGA